MMRVVVAGGGIAGLSTAVALRDRLPAGAEVLVLEAGPRLGGNIRTEREGGFIVEWGPNGYLDNVPTTPALVRRLGLADEVQGADARAARRFLFRGGRLHELPTQPLRFFASPVLSLPGRLRILGEPFARPRPAGVDESVGAFAARRIGPEATRILVDAMVSGVFAGDVDRLSLASAFPKMAKMEAEHGSLVRAMIAAGKARKRARQQASARGARADAGAGAEEQAGLRPGDDRRGGAQGRGAGSGGGPAGPGGVLTSFRSGLDTVITRLGAELGPSVRVAQPVRALFRGAGSSVWQVQTDDSILEADAVVLAIPASDAAPLLAPLRDGPGPELFTELAAIPSAPLAVVALAYDAAAMGGDPEGFGFLVPRGQGPRILGCLWDSSLFPGRAPAGKVLLRAMIGGAHDPAAVSLDDDTLLEIVRRDLATAMGLRAEPERRWIFRHRQGIAQYEIGHSARLARIGHALQALPGLWLAGASYHGVSMNACIEKSGEQAAEILAYLGRDGRTGSTSV